MKNSNNVEERLDRIKHLILSQKKTVRDLNPPSRYRKLAEAACGELIFHEAGLFCLIRTFYPVGHSFGLSVLREEAADTEIPCACFSALTTEGSVCLSDLLFFDTETTGLGGAGAVPFLVGFGSLVKGGFEIRQYLLPDYPDERAMLESLFSEMSASKTLVSYNGTAFDLPLLKDRFIVNRVSREIEINHHIDLLHSTRRLFRRRLGDCSLTNVERELFSFFRQDDLPGYLIPSVYFEWLSEDRVEDMKAVLEHNRLDIFALYFLVTYIASIFESEGGNLQDADDVYSLSRVYGRRKLNDTVVRLLQDLPSRQIQTDIAAFHAQALKRTGNWDEAVAIWTRLSQEKSREGYWACIELAKFHEHRGKNLTLAYKYARLAVHVCPYGPNHREQLRRRLDRLETKLN